MDRMVQDGYNGMGIGWIGWIWIGWIGQYRMDRMVQDGQDGKGWIGLDRMVQDEQDCRLSLLKSVLTFQYNDMPTQQK